MVDVPRSLVDRAIEERIKQEMIENRPPPDIFPGAARAFLGEGLGMGWGGEAEAWIRSKLGQGDYSPLQKDISKEYGRFAERYPKTSGVLEFAGGALPAVAAAAMAPATGGVTAPAAAAQGSRVLGALARMANNPYARSAATSAVQGGITGAGVAEEDSRGSGAAGGAALGAAIGAAAPVAVRTSKGALEWMRDRFLPTQESVRNRALGKMSSEVEAAGIKPGDILARMDEDRALGVPSVVANVNDQLAKLADTVANRAGKASGMVRTALGQQKEESRERVMDQVRKGVSGRDYFDDEASAVAKLRGNADTMYDDAYSFGDVQDPRIMKVLENPKFAAFFEKAKQIADTEAMAAELRGENPAKYQLKQLYKTKTDKDGNLVGFELVDVPDVRTLDYIKRGIDASIESGYQGGSLSKAEANALKDLRTVYTKTIDEVTTDPTTGRSAYADARKLYAGDMEVIDAMRMGYTDFNKMPPELIERFMKDASDAEKEAFRSGAVRNIYDMIMGPSSSINAAGRLVGSPRMEQKLDLLFDSPAKRDMFMAAVQRERELFDQASKALGGSQTAERTAMRERFEEGPNFGEMVSRAINSGGISNALMAIAARAASKTTMTDDVAEQVARRLLSKDPAEVAAVVKELEEFAAEQAPKIRNLSKTETGLGGGTTVSIPSAPESEDAMMEGDIERAMRLSADKKIEGPDIEADLAARSKR